MTLRQLVKYRLYDPLGAFPYFGFRVHFPRGSRAFRAACEQGIFEAGNIHILQKLYRPGTCMFDVGANLGLMALPILASVPDSKVISFEPSPNSLPWLRRTIARNGLADRWRLVEKAATSAPGVAAFTLSSPKEALYDGLKYTERVARKKQVEVELTTLDIEWTRLGCPSVSIIKIDVEGAEIDVLEGAVQCLSLANPFVLLEWNPTNLRAHGIPLHALFAFAGEHRYKIYALPEVIPVSTASDFELQILRTENFLLSPLTHSGEPSSRETGQQFERVFAY